MIDALGRPQSLLLLGGTSEIALAVARAWSDALPVVTLAARPGARRDEAVANLRADGFEVEARDFDAEDTDAHPALIEAVAAERDIDVAVVAFGVLGDEEEAWQDHAAAVRLAQVNYTGAVSVGVCLARVLRRQGHGTVVALSSAAGERVRRSNFVYGSSKAGMDGFYLGLGEALREYGGHVLVVRPGFVHTRMTQGREPAPMSVTAEQVAQAVVRGVAARAELVWVPTLLRGVMSGLRHVPRPLFRRLPL
jgi:decaprenylphospho-beta-D-erythro-pentofuranosid-2-ulose 2-reductase